MSWQPDRTGSALLLTAAAVVLPCAAWYVAGSRAVDARAQRLMAEPRRQARLEADRLAAQVARRLEALRQAETRRSFSEYMSDDELARAGCSYEVRVASPLAQGPADPLIWAHFQVDQLGQLTLPTLAGRPAAAARAAPSMEAIQLAIFDELECANSEHMAALRRRLGTAPARQPSAEGVVTVGPFSWHTVNVGDQPALVALREVTTPGAVLTQGFVVLRESLAALVEGALYPAAVRPGAPGGDGDSLVAIEGDGWTVGVDGGEALALAEVEAGRARAAFRRSFALGALAALLAGSLVVVLVRQADRLAEQRAEFAASAAHELRTPLAGLQLYGEMLADGSGDAEARNRYARRVAEEAQRLGRVVSNVLGFTRLQRGGVTARPEPGDLAAAVRESVERLRPPLEARGASLELRIDAALPPTRFDRDAVHQILQNLLDNAEKYTRGAPDRRVEVRLAAVETGAELSVIDHGAGVPPSLKSRLFRSFSRHASPHAPAGLGIGLALVQALCRAQGAEVAHRETPGGGAEFAVRFPRAAGSTPAQRAPRPGERRAGP